MFRNCVVICVVISIIFLQIATQAGSLALCDTCWDGYSRMTVYMKCTINNRSLIVLSAFLGVFSASEVRSDCWGVLLGLRSRVVSEVSLTLVSFILVWMFGVWFMVCVLWQPIEYYCMCNMHLVLHKIVKLHLNHTIQNVLSLFIDGLLKKILVLPPVDFLYSCIYSAMGLHYIERANFSFSTSKICFKTITVCTYVCTMY